MTARNVRKASTKSGETYSIRVPPRRRAPRTKDARAACSVPWASTGVLAGGLPLGERAARFRVGEVRVGSPRGRVVPDEHRRIEGGVEGVDHGVCAGLPAEEGRRLVEVLREEVVEVPMGVRDEDLFRAGVEATLDRRVGPPGHEPAATLAPPPPP